MTKNKSYRYGNYTFRAYFKPVGHGYEVGLICKGRSLFVGNFIHKREATSWWMQFNREIRHFATNYVCSKKTPHTWYFNFLSNHLYTCYYRFLDKMFGKYNRDFKRAFQKDVHVYKRMKKRWHTGGGIYHFHAKAA